MKASATQTKQQFLKNIPLFSSLSGEEMEHFLTKVDIKTTSKHGYIYLPDEVANHVFILMSGCIKIGTHSSDGREVIKSILYPTAVFGELALTGQSRRIDFAKAMNADVTLCVINLAALKTMIRSNHQFCLSIFELVGERLHEAENRLETLVLKDARSRIIDFIKESAEKHGQKIGFETMVKHSLTQQDIASLTGTSRQTVTSVLNDLKKSNLIYFNRNTILVRDMRKLA